MINALLTLASIERELIMDIQNILSNISSPSSSIPANARRTGQGSPLDGLSSMLPDGLVGGAAAGGLAYKAYGNWQKNKAIGQTQAVTDQDIEYVKQTLEQYQSPQTAVIEKPKALELAMITAMIAASKSDGIVDSSEHKKLFETVEKMNLSNDDKATVLELMSRDISADDVASLVSSDQHKAQVYISAYLAIEVDDQRERSFLNQLAISLALAKGFPAYLEPQADHGITD